MQKVKQYFAKLFMKRPTVRSVAVVVGVLGLFASLWSMLTQIATIGIKDSLINLSSNLGTELVGIAITVLVIDFLYQRQSFDQLRRQLIRELRSPDNGIALRALEEIKANGWLKNGTLRRSDLAGANLEGCDLTGADLQGANLSRANLKDATMLSINLKNATLISADLRNAKLGNIKFEESPFAALVFRELGFANLEGANLTHANLEQADLTFANLRGARLYLTNLVGTRLSQANLEGVQGLFDVQFTVAMILRGARMPDGNRYDGRFNLPGDSLRQRLWNSKDAAEFFGISVDEYDRGQQWAQANLSELRAMWESHKEGLELMDAMAEADYETLLKLLSQKLNESGKGDAKIE
jgi:uncharacterized protein YjbI with pentapeptide repeats